MPHQPRVPTRTSGRSYPLWLLYALACGGKSTDSGNDELISTATATEPTDPSAPTGGGIEEGLTVEQVFGVPERAWDLGLSPSGLVYCTAQGGGKIYTWDPVAQDRDELTDDVGGVRAIAFEGDQPWVTTTAEGVTGTLGPLEGRETTPIYTQADDGTLFRDPVDLIATSDGGWLIADDDAPAIFHVAANQSVTAHEAGSTSPQALALHDDRLYVGGDDGIWAMDWPSGAPEQIDERSTYGLLMVNGKLWASNASEGLFIVGGDSLGVTDLARAGSMVLDSTSEVVYVADRVGEYVWSVSTTP